MNAGFLFAEEEKLIEDYVRNPDLFEDEFESVTAALRSDEPYFNRQEYGDTATTVGIAAKERGYVAGRIDLPGNQFYVLSLESDENRVRFNQSPRLIEYDDLPNPHITHGRRIEFYYDILKEVSPAPDEDIRAFYDDFDPYRD